jgi:hypothetical protein
MSAFGVKADIDPLLISISIFSLFGRASFLLFGSFFDLPDHPTA